ncbi:uncharacterized protein LOC127094508 [Lathyrus oleraceus]|uniref:uncharacterized protein LOC127094508 n=1 Tax=Pisum sativum TaxID=3888 RepID=UPI0021CFE36E|nr:uncharacterized protein LOC127094508 [Pisum sativum]
MQMFVNGLKIKTKQLIDTAAGGSTNFSTTTGIKKIIEVIAANKHMELYDRCQSKLEGVIDLKLETNKIRIEDTIPAEVDKKLKVEEIKFLKKNNPYSNKYNPGWKNHPNFSWKDQKAIAPQHGQYQTQYQQHQQQQIPKKAEWEIAIERMATYHVQFQAQGVLPSAIVPNPREHHNGMKIPIKEEDRGAVTISCTIGDRSFNKALIDLGASVSLMPLSIYKKLGIEVVQDTRMTLQFADYSVKKPYGIVKDVLVKIDKFVFPVDFLILEMPEDEEITLILGRPFLETGRCVINIEAGTMTLKVYDEEVKINV